MKNWPSHYSMDSICTAVRSMTQHKWESGAFLPPFRANYSGQFSFLSRTVPADVIYTLTVEDSAGFANSYCQQDALVFAIS